MKLDAKQVGIVLQDMGGKYLYHANSLITTCTFLDQQSLLSRGQVEDRGLNQTSQTSDKLDKDFQIWNNIFLDTVDIHSRAGRQNYYGPILFVFDIKLLENPPIKSISISKKNPTDWKPDENLSERYFASAEEVKASFGLNDFGSMILLHDNEGILPLKENLRNIIVDKINIKYRINGKAINITDYAINELQLACKRANLKDDIVEARSCRSWCGCHDWYNKYLANTKNMFAKEDGGEVTP